MNGSIIVSNIKFNSNNPFLRSYEFKKDYKKFINDNRSEVLDTLNSSSESKRETYILTDLYYPVDTHDTFRDYLNMSSELNEIKMDEIFPSDSHKTIEIDDNYLSINDLRLMELEVRDEYRKSLFGIENDDIYDPETGTYYSPEDQVNYIDAMSRDLSTVDLHDRCLTKICKVDIETIKTYRKHKNPEREIEPCEHRNKKKPEFDLDSILF